MQQSLARVASLNTGHSQWLQSLPSHIQPSASDAFGLFQPLSAPNAMLAWLRMRNSILDGLFYDVNVISAQEAKALGPWSAREGALVYAPCSGAGDVQVAATLDDLAAIDGPAPKALAIAGVGSSALGTAALARNVADAIGAPALGIVSGYGMSDLITEALGGYFLFGSLNRLRNAFESLDDAARMMADHTTSRGAGTLNMADISLDVETAEELLRDERFDLELLVGHSKGNLVLAEALESLVEVSPERAKDLAETTQIVTLSAVIKMPRPFKKIIDIIGNCDPLGTLNSIWGLPIEHKLKGVGHHTNTELAAFWPKPLDVTKSLKAVLG